MNRIKELRIEKKMSQTDLANSLNLAQQTISGYENGTRLLDTEKAEQIANFFNVSIDYLLGRTNIRNVYLQSKQDIGNELEDIKKRLLEQDGLMFYGEELDEETIHLVADAIDMGMKIIDQKIKSKEKNEK